MYRKTYRSGWHGAVNLLNKIYSYFGATGAADTSIHMQGKQLFIVHAAFLSQYFSSACLQPARESQHRKASKISMIEPVTSSSVSV